MNPPHIPSIFDSFNARALEPSEVALTFVPSPAYLNLIKRCHTVIVGPRGSGKTTLLKMLQQPALEGWHHESAQGVRATLDFTGVFIPTDVSWSEQLKALGMGHLDESTRTTLSVATFTTHVLRSLVIAILSRLSVPTAKDAIPFRRATLPPQKEIALCKHLCSAWHLKQTVPSLLAIKHALSMRLGDIRELASLEATLGDADRPKRLAQSKYLHMHFIQSAALAVELFDDGVPTLVEG